MNERRNGKTKNVTNSLVQFLEHSIKHLAPSLRSGCDCVQELSSGHVGAFGPLQYDKMSALQATQADGYYYPPGWDPSKGSLDKFHGSHGKLGSRARKQHLGILVVRIEMPYNAWCKHCNVHIGRGVRYNAEKSKVGMYHSTPILDFKFRCAACSGELHFRTDPENRGYAAGEGLRWQAKHEIARKEEQEVELMSHDEKLALASDGMVALEHAKRDEAAAAAQAKALEALMQSQQRAKDDYSANAQLRSAMRGRRRQALALKAEAAARGFTRGLLPITAADHAAAQSAFENRVVSSVSSLKSPEVALEGIQHLPRSNGTAVGIARGASVRIRKRQRDNGREDTAAQHASPSKVAAVSSPAPESSSSPEGPSGQAAACGLVDYESDS